MAAFARSGSSGSLLRSPSQRFPLPSFNGTIRAQGASPIEQEKNAIEAEEKRKNAERRIIVEKQRQAKEAAATEAERRRQAAIQARRNAPVSTAPIPESTGTLCSKIRGIDRTTKLKCLYFPDLAVSVKDILTIKKIERTETIDGTSTITSSSKPFGYGNFKLFDNIETHNREGRNNQDQCFLLDSLGILFKESNTGKIIYSPRKTTYCIQHSKFYIKSILNTNCTYNIQIQKPGQGQFDSLLNILIECLKTNLLTKFNTLCKDPVLNPPVTSEHTSMLDYLINFYPHRLNQRELITDCNIFIDDDKYKKFFGQFFFKQKPIVRDYIQNLERDDHKDRKKTVLLEILGNCTFGRGQDVSDILGLLRGPSPEEIAAAEARRRAEEEARIQYICDFILDPNKSKDDIIFTSPSEMSFEQFIQSQYTNPDLIQTYLSEIIRRYIANDPSLLTIRKFTPGEETKNRTPPVRSIIPINDNIFIKILYLYTRLNKDIINVTTTSAFEKPYKQFFVDILYHNFIYYNNISLSNQSKITNYSCKTTPENSPYTDCFSIYLQEIHPNVYDFIREHFNSVTEERSIREGRLRENKFIYLNKPRVQLIQQPRSGTLYPEMFITIYNGIQKLQSVNVNTIKNRVRQAKEAALQEYLQRAHKAHKIITNHRTETATSLRNLNELYNQLREKKIATQQINDTLVSLRRLRDEKIKKNYDNSYQQIETIVNIIKVPFQRSNSELQRAKESTESAEQSQRESQKGYDEFNSKSDELRQIMIGLLQKHQEKEEAEAAAAAAAAAEAERVAEEARKKAKENANKASRKKAIVAQINAFKSRLKALLDSCDIINGNIDIVLAKPSSEGVTETNNKNIEFNREVIELSNGFGFNDWKSNEYQSWRNSNKNNSLNPEIQTIERSLDELKKKIDIKNLKIDKMNILDLFWKKEINETKCQNTLDLLTDYNKKLENLNIPHDSIFLDILILINKNLNESNPDLKTKGEFMNILNEIHCYMNFYQLLLTSTEPCTFEQLRIVMHTEPGENGKNYSLIRQLIKSINIQLYIYLETIIETPGISEEVVAKVTQIYKIRKNIHGVLNKCIEEYATNVDNFSNGNVPNYRSEERATFNGFLNSFIKLLNGINEAERVYEDSRIIPYEKESEENKARFNAFRSTLRNVQAKQTKTVPRTLYKKLGNNKNLVNYFLTKYKIRQENLGKILHNLKNIKINN